MVTVPERAASYCDDDDDDDDENNNNNNNNEEAGRKEEGRRVNRRRRWVQGVSSVVRQERLSRKPEKSGETQRSVREDADGDEVRAERR